MTGYYVEVFKQCFTYQGPSLWNNLPEDLKKCGSIDTFNFRYKKVFNVIILCILTGRQGRIHITVIALPSINIFGK